MAALGRRPGPHRVVRERTRDDGWVVLAVPAADEQALAAMLLQFGADVEAMDPATLRDEVIRRLKASLDA
jgi:predicted DNA-binding transcriptional regulator YafY